MRLRMVLALFAALALTVGVTSATADKGKGKGGNSNAAKACQKGGYKNLYRSDGTGFKNAGKCVSYAAQGGTLQTKCQVGSWSTTGVTPCGLADIGFYVDTVGATSQTACPVGETTLGTGSTGATDCIAAPLGAFRP